MPADIRKEEKGYSARFERHVDRPAEEVWAWLTENEKLTLWFPELGCDDLREGGRFKFDMGDGSFEEMRITGFDRYSLLEYEWGEDSVRFELAPVANGCRLTLTERIGKLTDHTPKDLAGWHVCLDAVEALAEGRGIPDRREEWQTRYAEYASAIRNL